MQERRTDEALSAQHAARRAWRLVLAVASGVILLDQLTKSWAEAHLAERVVHLVGSLQLALAYNHGVAFGLGAGIGPLLVAVAVVGLVVAFAGKHITVSRPTSVAVGLLLGGAFGNLADRLLRGHGGAVVDFIDLQWWPVFNLADASVVIGAILFVVINSRKPVE